MHKHKHTSENTHTHEKDSDFGGAEESAANLRIYVAVVRSESASE